MLEILKILRRAYQNDCLNIVHAVITQLAQGYTETPPGTYRGPPRDSQVTNTKIYGL